MDFLSAAITLFLIMDPLGNIPVFHSVLEHVPAGKKTRVMARELVFAFLVLLAFLFAGETILGVLGLKRPTLGIAGGLILFLIALRMVFPSQGLAGAEDSNDPFIVPLAVPLIAGPSAIAALLLLASRDPDRIWVWAGALSAAWVVSAAILLLSNHLLRWIGPRGVRAAVKLMGMLLIMIAVQMFLDGVKEYMG
ncbi:MAG: NAAT family transporter [Desulfobacterales bacterium]|nr:NAAT family transporter [Desulfobacterales bacterium]